MSWKTLETKRPWPTLRNNYAICLGGSGETTKNIKEDIRHKFQRLELEPDNYQAFDCKVI